MLFSEYYKNGPSTDLSYNKYYKNGPSMDLSYNKYYRNGPSTEPAQPRVQSSASVVER